MTKSVTKKLSVLKFSQHLPEQRKWETSIKSGFPTKKYNRGDRIRTSFPEFFNRF